MSAGGDARGNWRELKVKVGREAGWRMRGRRQSKDQARRGARCNRIRRGLHLIRVLQEPENLLVEKHHCRVCRQL